MRLIHDIAGHATIAVMAVASVLFGILCGLAIVVAAVIPPIIGLVRFMGAELAAAGHRMTHPYST